MESIIKGKTKIKKFKKENSPLKKHKIDHSHHSKNFYIEKNFARYFKINYKDDESVMNALKEKSQSGIEDLKIESTFIYNVLFDSVNLKKNQANGFSFKSVRINFTLFVWEYMKRQLMVMRNFLKKLKNI